MQRLIGKPISPGYAQGTAFVFDDRTGAETPCYRIARGDIPTEHKRFHHAVERSYWELKSLERQVLSELGDSQSAIFAAHLGLLKDRQFADRVTDRISRDLVNVEHALDAEVADLCQLLLSVEDEYIRERSQDIRDVGKRVLRQLTQHDADRYEDLPPQSVIVAEELLPSQTVDLDRQNVVAIVTERGGENSHAAILARALGIPAVTGIEQATSFIARGTKLLVDGRQGAVTITPSDSDIRDFKILKHDYDDAAATFEAAERLECVTKDGQPITLLANINRPHEVELVASHHLDGVGLFRTEFMFLDSETAPDVTHQAKIYGKALAALDDRPLVIRTLDLGGDKVPAFLARPHEANPHLGLRGLQLSLADRSLLETQLRAIMTAIRSVRDSTASTSDNVQQRVSQENVRILFPMVLGPEDLREGLEIARNIAADFDLALPLVGAMIETPASLFVLDEILKLADFISIGTNDLTQFMLAADRDAAELADQYSVLHPAVLRAISNIIDACNRSARELCVCGESAGEPPTACVFVGLGVRQLSMSPLRAAQVRYTLRATDSSELRELANQALRYDSTQAVKQLLRDTVEPIYGMPY